MLTASCQAFASSSLASCQNLGSPFRPNDDYSYSPNEHGLLDGIAPGSTIVVEASANLIKIKIERRRLGGLRILPTSKGLAGGRKEQLLAADQNFSVPIPPIVLGQRCMLVT